MERPEKSCRDGYGGHSQFVHFPSQTARAAHWPVEAVCLQCGQQKEPREQRHEHQSLRGYPPGVQEPRSPGPAWADRSNGAQSKPGSLISRPTRRRATIGTIEACCCVDLHCCGLAAPGCVSAHSWNPGRLLLRGEDQEPRGLAAFAVSTLAGRGSQIIPSPSCHLFPVPPWTKHEAVPCSWRPGHPSPTVWVFVSRRDVTPQHGFVQDAGLSHVLHSSPEDIGLRKKRQGTTTPREAPRGLSPPELQQLQQLQLGPNQVVSRAVNPRCRSHSRRGAMSRTQPTSDNANRERGARKRGRGSAG